MYTVNLHGSDPALENDDCYTGDEFPTLEEARKVFQDPFSYFHGPLMTVVVNGKCEQIAQPGASYYSGELWVEIDGHDVHEVRCHTKGSKKRANDDWRHEQAMEAGMLHGVEAYNDVMES